MPRIAKSPRLAIATLAVPALAAGALLLAGCGDPTVGDVEDKLAEQLKEQGEGRGVAFSDDVTCPADVELKTGAKFECTAPATERNQQVVYTVSVEMTGDNSFNYRVTGVKPADGGGTTTPGG
ncbi:MAG: DUF4333 domain-containing protein [Thermoleophilia bacterium]|nr:DUF4333 domain-containing protein [Thermoleophilia bacterium]